MEILILLVLGAGFVAMLALIVVLTIYRGRQRGRDWAAAAGQLGLTLGPATHRAPFAGDRPTIHMPMRGARAGLPVEIGIKVVIRHGANNRRYRELWTYVRVSFPRSLDLGLAAHTTGFVGRAFQALAGQTDVQVGDPELDAAYEIKAADPGLVARLFQVPYLREALMWHAHHAPMKPWVGDGQVYASVKRVVTDPGALATTLDNLVDLARRVLAARAQIGPSEGERAVQEQWRQVAERRGLALDVEGTRMSGRTEGVYVEVDAQLVKQQRWTVFTVRFDRPLGASLKMTRQSSLHSIGKLLGMQDIEVGDPAFDARFLIKGSPPDRVRALLTPEVRARLAELSDRASALEVHDDRLEARVGWLVAQAADVDSGLAMVARAGAALSGQGAAEAGPFR